MASPTTSQQRSGGPRPERSRRRRRPQGAFSGAVLAVYGDDTCPHVRLFPAPGAESCTDPDVWTPSRRRA